MRRTDIHEILNPRSIAIVEVSSNPIKGATIFLHTLLAIGYEGKLYPVNPDGEDSLGMKTYRCLLDVPDSVDHVIVGVPAHRVLAEIENAVRIRARSIHIYSAGFEEINTDEGLALKKEIMGIARGKVRVIGPNCMGIYYPKKKISFYFDQSPLFGGSAFVSQSGGLAGLFSFVALQENNYCSKVVSIGNSWDLKLTDFLEYFSEDEETETVSMYIEGLGNGEGRKLLSALKNTTKRKPVIIFKGGRSEEGERAASSHTGALASNFQIWNTLTDQYGVILVDSIEEMHDFIKLYRMVHPPRSKRSCLVAFGGGGRNVTYADICAKNGLSLPKLQKEVQDGLLDFIPQVGTMRDNPVDLSGGVFDPTVLVRTLETVSRDPNVDSIIFTIDVLVMHTIKDLLGTDPRDIVKGTVSALVSVKDHLEIPIFCCNPVSMEDLEIEELRLYLKEELEKNNIPSILTIERTTKAIKRYHDYSSFKSRESCDRPPLA